ncbi:MAG: alpha/beta hydrolase [Deltaproteobacteria bacterium]|nr:alpha/beta hydrolase [Deltaproteobacteria bacterium]
MIGLLTAVYLAAHRETISLNAKTRAQFGGLYAQLPEGMTHYELLGNDDHAPLVVFLHGSTVSIWDFDLQVKALLSAGFRVLRYDALGRGLSDRPEIAYTRDVYVSQLKHLLKYLKVSEPVFLLGHSLGGATAMQFSASYPSKVRGIALLSPVINSVHVRAPFFVCNTPVVGDVLLRLAMIKILHVRANQQWEGAPVDMSYYDELFARQTAIQGFEHAVCSMFQTDLIGDYRDTYKQVGESGIPGWLVYGGKDNAIWPGDVEALKSDMPSFRFRFFPDGAHSIHVQYSGVFNRELVRFFQSQLQ